MHLRPPSRLLATLVAACAAVACSKKSNEQSGSGMVGAGATGAIVVGHVGSMTGTEATFGLSSDRGMKLAFNEINAKGGIKNRKIDVKTYDDQGKPEEAATAVTRLIASDHATAILGEVASTRSLFMAPKAQAAHVPMVTPSSTNPKVTQQGDYIFRACFIDTFQGYVMAKFAADYLKVKRVAILRDVRNDYSVGLAENFTQNFTKMGGQIVGSESFSNGDVDFKAQLTNIKGSNPEAIFVPAYYTEVGLIARQARDAGISVPLLGGDGWDSTKLYEIGGAALEGSYFANHYAADDPDPVIQQRIQHFTDAFRKTWSAEPDGLSAQAYDAAAMLADAMGRATDLTGPAIRDALAKTKDFHGVTGDITMDENRNPVKSAVVLEVTKGGKYKFTTRIQPEGVKASTTTETAPAHDAPAAAKK